MALSDYVPTTDVDNIFEQLLSTPTRGVEDEVLFRWNPL
jgi:hypothetical protein